MRHPRLVTALSAVLIIAFAGQAWSKQNKQTIRAELISLQEQTGLTVGSVDFSGVDAVSFANRSWLPIDVPDNFKRLPYGTLSPDGEQIAFHWRPNSSYDWPSWLSVVRRDGSGLREYPNLQSPYGICWSPDRSKLVFTVSSPAEPQTYRLVLLDLATGVSQEIQSGGRAQTQCFSPDGMQIVYETDSVRDKHGPHGLIRVYDIRTGNSHELLSGAHPTWSPRGTGIAFLDRDAYYLISPSGEGKKRLFKNRYAYSALWWSPDSRFVAYGAYCCFWKSIKYMVDIGHLRIRRLEDNADDWVAETSPPTGSYGWIQLAPRKHD